MASESLAISLLSLAIDVANLELTGATTKEEKRIAFDELVRLRECLELLQNPKNRGE